MRNFYVTYNEYRFCGEYEFYDIVITLNKGEKANLSTFENKVDQKGRVSVPSQFRSIIQEEESNSLVLYESSINKCIEGCCVSMIVELSKKIDELDPFSNDKDGRILLPKNLLDFANITNSAVFIGKGQIFEIWEPKA